MLLGQLAGLIFPCLSAQCQGPEVFSSVAALFQPSCCDRMYPCALLRRPISRTNVSNPIKVANMRARRKHQRTPH
ncbi:hypothetical protein B0T19DRAFT_409727 [Cercophora scortea]|uniref:Secreted protein n=1 Tax=Cercophora scortea TaxID=314031 RepID=A0AAE0J404_9PEZI|nr:hypothetical protein B0T19DRAFT_409727 [Cercophora scortea]